MTNSERAEIARIVESAWNHDRLRQERIAREIARNVSTSK